MINKVFPIPVYAVMICVLFDQESNRLNFKSPIDIYKALLGMILKATEIKSLERELAKEKDVEKKM